MGDGMGVTVAGARDARLDRIRVAVPAVVDEGALIVRRTIRIAAPIEKVWRAVTEPALISQRFGETALADPTPGGHGMMACAGHGAVPLQLESHGPPRRPRRARARRPRGALPRDLIRAQRHSLMAGRDQLGVGRGWSGSGDAKVCSFGPTSARAQCGGWRAFGATA